MTTGADPLESLAEQGITVAWASGLAWRALWLADERVMVLDAGESRQVLAREVSDLLAGG